MIFLILNSGLGEFNSKLGNSAAPHQKMNNASIVMANFMLSIWLNGKLG
jgi:hypothetical protein